jgi:hypothetical protein
MLAAVALTQGSTISSSWMPWTSAPRRLGGLPEFTGNGRAVSAGFHAQHLAGNAGQVHFESRRKTRVWLLGAQPESLKPAPALSPAIQTTLAILTELIDQRRQRRN